MGGVKIANRVAKAREYAVAEELGRQERAAGLRATHAYYEVSTGRVVMELPNGYAFGVPLAQLREIKDASQEDLRAVEVLGAGNVLHWEKLDADYSVPALIMEGVGPDSLSRAFASRGGKATSPAKAKSSRANGALGGRPRKGPAVAGLGAIGGPEGKRLQALGVTKKKSTTKKRRRLRRS